LNTVQAALYSKPKPFIFMPKPYILNYSEVAYSSQVKKFSAQSLVGNAGVSIYLALKVKCECDFWSLLSARIFLPTR